jgi:hypothetical protein
MTIFEYLNIKPNQPLYFSDEKIYAYADILMNYHTGEILTLNKEESLAKQLKVTDFPFTIKDKKNKQLYYENIENRWTLYQYDQHGNQTYYTTHDGFWAKSAFDHNNKLIYYINSFNFWEKYEYDEHGNQTYFENSHSPIIKNPITKGLITINK